VQELDSQIGWKCRFVGLRSGAVEFSVLTRCDVEALGDWCPTFRDSAMISWVGMPMQCFGAFRPLNIERNTLPQNVGDHSSGDKKRHATRTETSRWKCDGCTSVFVRFDHKGKRTKINKSTSVAVLLVTFLNLCIYALIDLYRIKVIITLLLF
jgi:hypothetical protein